MAGRVKCLTCHDECAFAKEEVAAFPTSVYYIIQPMNVARIYFDYCFK
jgi:hypothetical protein